jgi:peptidylprolyl isomerase
MVRVQLLKASIAKALASAFCGMLIGILTLGSSVEAAGVVTTLTGLQIIDNRIGVGSSPKTGHKCAIHYTGWLYVNGAKDRKFDSSLDRGKPFEFVIGKGQVIKGWDEGIATMKVGGNRTLIVPPDLGYGATGLAGTVPPNAWLAFDIDLLGVQ